MKVFFVALILCHLMVTKSTALNRYTRFKNKILEGDGTLGLGVNNTGHNHRKHSASASLRTIVQPHYHCYKKFFVQGDPPTGLRPGGSRNIKYICQDLAEFNDETYYATMFDQHIGIAVYSAYIVKYDQVPSIGIFPRISKWLQDPDIDHTRQGSDQMYHNNGQHIHKGHLVPAKTYSYDCIAMVSTFRYTNAVPQYAAFNTGRWGQYEEKVRRLADICRQNDRGDLYIMTGTSEAKLLPGGPPHAQQQALNYFPHNNARAPNIAIPNSMWTAGCCISRRGDAVGGFAAIGNNDQANPVLEQKTVAQLQDILAIGRGGGAVELFPGNDRCADDSMQFRYNDLAFHGGAWSKSKKF